MDTAVTKSTALNRVVTQGDWKIIYPSQIPRRKYFTFRYGKPVLVEDENVAKFLMGKFETIKPTVMEIDKIIAHVAGLEYNKLKVYGLRYGMGIKEVSIKKDQLFAIIKKKLLAYELPMDEEVYEEFKKNKGNDNDVLGDTD